MSKSWKSTLKLPRSTFPVRPNPKLQPQYFRECTESFYQWQESNRPKEDPFVLHDGPPYANGPLHIGHALNKVLKDLVLRTQVSQGRRVVYRPSWDCHGLPIEMKALGDASGKGLSPVQIRKSARKLATKTIVEQMKGFQSFAVMADWQNKWTTMDREYEIRQLRVFQQMVDRGLIYRKHKPVYWSVSSRTALAEAELEYRDDHVSNTAYVKFPVVAGHNAIPELQDFPGDLYAAIWTTTPWTLPANRAIAVHNDLEYAVLQIGSDGVLVAESRIEALQAAVPSARVITRSIPGSALTGLKYRNRLRGHAAPEQPILHADFVSADSGTGLVHMAPGHGQDDYEVCAQHGIEAFAPITDEGFFTNEAFPDAPEKLTSAPSILEGGSQAVLDLIQKDVLAMQKLVHKYPYDWRTKRPVVIRATAQWFADVGSIKNDAMKALSKVKFVPESGRARLESFVQGRSEWCISRQRSWGVPIPALYGEDGNAAMTKETIDHIISVMQERTLDAWFSDAADESAWIPPSLKGTYRRGTDTMDVWFDSGSSWTEVGRPVDVYLEGSDQHRGWFQSSLLTYIAAQGGKGSEHATPPTSPFGTLVTHGFTLDAQGKKMSKSIGNTVHPQQVMDGSLLPPLKTKAGQEPRFDALGPDALRLWAASCDFTSDILIGPSILQSVHTALIKYRTTLKLLTGTLHESARQAPLTKLDQIAILQLTDVMTEVMDAYRSYEFHKAVGIINRWVAADLSAFYLDALKDRLYCGDGGGALEPIFVGFLRMLAPITPILVEEAWSHRPLWMLDDSTLEHPARQIYGSPLVDASRLSLDPIQIRQDLPVLNAVRDAINRGLEEAREVKHVGSSLQCSVIISSSASEVTETLAQYQNELDAIFVVSSVEIDAQIPDTSSWCYKKEFETGQGSGVVLVLPPKQSKCSRCWRYLAEEEEGLCPRCDEVVAAISEANAS